MTSFNGTVEPFYSRNSEKTLYRVGVTGQSKRVIVNRGELVEIWKRIGELVQEDNNGIIEEL